MENANYRRLYNAANAVVLAFVAAWLFRDFRVAWGGTPRLEDAYMFARYAMNVRHGFGVSWNPDGVHTYGQTSLLWCGVVTVLSYFPMGVGHVLVLGSWLSSLGALMALAWAVAVNANSYLMSGTLRVLPFVALPLLATSVFSGNACNGMETMLAVLLCAVFVGLALKWQRGAARPETVGLVGVLLFLTRPEAGVVAVLFPLLLFILMQGVAKGSVARLLGTFFAGVALTLVVCKWYFHTALPLSFYMKSLHAYKGYILSEVWYPELSMLAFFVACELYFITIVFLSRKDNWRLLVCCLLPVLVTFVYLQTVLQISGYFSRYYAPYFALLIVPALLVADQWFGAASRESSDELWPGTTLVMRSCVAGVIVLGCFALCSSGRLTSKIRRTEGKIHYRYDPAHLDTAVKVQLPYMEWYTMIHQVTDLLVRPLPKGVTIAASEVGYLGSSAPQVNIIDLVGLNDLQIATHGFDMSVLLARKPDMIWMPDIAYTYQRGVMLSDPELLREYDVYAGAANYGLAIRKDSPYRGRIDQQMQVFWSATYPRYKMSDYLVRSSSWSGANHQVLDQ